MKDRHGEHVFCELPDGTICSLPTWMFSPDCTRLSLGRPVISVGALVELRDLLNTLQHSAGCGKPSLKSLPKEGKNEAISEANGAAVKPATDRRSGSNGARRQTKRAGGSTHGTVDKRRSRKQQTARRRRRS